MNKNDIQIDHVSECFGRQFAKIFKYEEKIEGKNIIHGADSKNRAEKTERHNFFLDFLDFHRLVLIDKLIESARKEHRFICFCNLLDVSRSILFFY